MLNLDLEQEKIQQVKFETPPLHQILYKKKNSKITINNRLKFVYLTNTIQFYYKEKKIRFKYKYLKKSFLLN